MADDPNRDILPVKEWSCADTCRSNIDPSERHFVCKLDRYQLEDRYLRLLDEANDLKKLSHSQEDKIKRLATKLMRVSANPYACTLALDVSDDKNRITALELENTKLKDKLSVLKNQLLSHTIAGRSSSRSRNPLHRPSSGRITCRSENSRMKTPSCQCIVQTGNDDNDAQNYLVKIEELERERKEMIQRIAQLEKDLASYAVGTQREKVAENVEYIRVWRHMKQLNDKLIAAQTTNEELNAQINDLKKILEERMKNNQEITAALVAEKKRVAEIDEQVLKIKDSQLALREKDEQVRDLINEVKILQQHNSELIHLSSKYGDVEVENVELKKKVSEQLQYQQSLKTAFSTEQANIIALQTANEQLLGKLQELQKNMDGLTAQLTSFKTQLEKHESSSVTQVLIKPIAGDERSERSKRYKDSASQVDQWRTCCETNKSHELERTAKTVRENEKLLCKSIQTDYCLLTNMNKKDQETSAMTPIKERKGKVELKNVQTEVEKETVPSNPLTPEKMLKLLEEAQISTPLETARIGHKDGAGTIEYTGRLDLNQRHSGTEIPGLNLQEESLSIYKNSQRKHDKTTDANNILLILLKILQEYSTNSSAISDIKETFYRPIGAVKDQFAKDINNNIDSKNMTVTKVGSNISISKHHLSHHEFVPDDSNIREKQFNFVRRCYNTKKSYCNIYNKSRAEKAAKKNVDVNAIKERNRTSKLTKKNNCTCSEDKKCYQNAECSYQCCGTNVPCSAEVKTSNSLSFQAGSESIPIKNAMRDVTSSIEKNINTIYMTRTMQNVRKVGPFKSWDQTKLSSRKQNVDDEQQLNAYMRHVGKCRELLNSEPSMVNSTSAGVNNIVDQTNERRSLRHEYDDEETRKIDSACSIDCQSGCTDLKSCISDTFPLIIKDGEGLVEIHILKLQLSTSAMQILSRNNEINNTSLFISWNIWEQETTRTIPKKCMKLNFDSSFVYRIPDLFDFFNCVLSKHVIFQVNIQQENQENCVVARAKLCIKDILDYPQNKLHYIAPVNSVLPCFLGTNFGQLSLWIRLSCNIEKVAAFKKKCGFYFPSEHIETIINPGSKKAPQELKFSPHVLEDTQDLEYKGPQDPIGFLKDTVSRLQERSQIPEEKDESAEFLPEDQPTPTETTDTKIKTEKDESDIEVSSELLNFDRSSSIIDAMDNEDESSEEDRTGKKFRESVKMDLPMEEGKGKKEDGGQAETSSLIEFNTLLKNLPEKDMIIIEIVHIILFQKSSVMQDDEMQMFYVEYNFLGYYGAEMETISVEKSKLPNQKMTFNFIRKFQIDEDTHAAKRKTLHAMLKHSINPNIRFVLVSEPLPRDTNVKECVEVGYADFNIREYALGSGHKSVSLPIMCHESSEPIGVLKIFVFGLDAIRQCLGEDRSTL